MRAGFALDPEAAALDGADVVDGGIEEEVDLLLQLLIEVFQHNEVDVRAEMADGGIEQVELVLDAELFETGAGGGVEFGARAAVGHVDLVNIVHQLERLLFLPMCSWSVPPKSFVMLYFPSENAPAPPKPLMIEHVWHLMHDFTRSPSMGQRRLASGWPASKTAIFRPRSSFVSS